MSIFENLIFLLEFLFEGYCAYTYFSTFFERNDRIRYPLMLYIVISAIWFFLYATVDVVINLMLFLATNIIITKLCYKTDLGSCVLHSFIFSSAFVGCELLTIPLSNLLLQNDYIQIRSFEAELFISTISKLLLFIACKLVQKYALKELERTKGIWLFLLPMSSLICIMGIYYLAGYCRPTYISSIIISLCSICLLAANIVVFLVHENQIKISSQLTKLHLAEQKSELDYNYYRVLQSSYDKSRVAVHDSKHHLNVINSMAYDKNYSGITDYIASLLGQDYYTAGSCITKNKIFDIIIMQAKEQCQRKGINFSFEHNNHNLSFVEDADLCCIVSNLLDNAIEAAEGSAGKRVNMLIYTNPMSSMYFLEVNNSCDNPPKTKNNFLITIKKDKERHGLGLYSVRLTAKKYGGEINYKYDSEKKSFKTIVMLNKR